MKIRPLIYIFLFICFTCAPIFINPCASRAEPAESTIKVGIVHSYPILFTDAQGRAQGIYVDLLNEIAKRENWEIDYIDRPWAEELELLKQGELDLLSCITYTEQRDQYMDFTKEAVLTLWAQVFTRQNSDIHSILDLEGKSVGVIKGDIIAAKLKELSENFWISCRYVELPNAIDVFQALKDVKVDAGLTNNVFGYSKASDYNIVGSSIIFYPNEVRFASPQGRNAIILEKIDSYLSTWKKQPDSLYYEVLNKWYAGKKPRSRIIPVWLVAVFLAAIALIVLMLIWNRTLRYQVNKRTNELKKSESLFRGMFEQAHQLLGLLTLDGVLITVNKTALEMAGADESMISGKKFWETPWWMHSEETQHRLEEGIKNAAAGELVVFETTHKALDGSLVDIDFSLKPIKNDSGEVILLLAEGKDITAFKKAEERYRVLFEAASDAILLLKEGMFSDCNEKAEKLFGCSHAQLTGSSPFDFSPFLQPDGSPSDEKAKEKILAAMNGTPQFFEWRHTTYNGEEFDAEVSLNRIEINGRVLLHSIVRDISERKHAEAERELLISAIEQASEIVMITDADGTIQYVNKAFEAVTGYTQNETLGRNPNILKSGKHGDSFYRALWDTIKGGKTWSGRIVNQTKTGKLFTEETRISPIRAQNGTIKNFVAVKRDITHEMEMEKMLHQAQKMEAIGTLAGGISHDFNNILSAIIGFSELTLMNLEKDSTAYQHLEHVLQAGERARELVKQILTFSRQSEQEKKPLLLKPIAGEALKLLRASLPSTIEIRQDLDSDATIMGDPTSMHQVFMNLCTNAAYAMKETGGVLEVKLKNASVEESYSEKHFEIKPGDYVKITISDTGCGIPPEIKDRIFDPFFTTKQKGEGTGMGLSVVHGIVKSCGGGIILYSEPEKGTVFNIFLPALASAAAVDISPKSTIPCGTEHIFFVDDEKAIVELGEHLLTSLGYKVTSTVSPVEALSIFEQNADKFDIVITDLTMPQMTGLTLAEELIKIKPDIPVILCSGFSASIDQNRSATAGIKAIVNKPVMMRDIAEVIRDVLEGGTSSDRETS